MILLKKLMLFLIAVLVFSSFASAALFTFAKPANPNAVGSSDTSSRIAKLEHKVSVLEAQNKVLLALANQQALLSLRTAVTNDASLAPSEKDSMTNQIDFNMNAAYRNVDALIGKEDFLGEVFSGIASDVAAMVAGAEYAGSKEPKGGIVTWGNDVLGDLGNLLSGEGKSGEEKSGEEKQGGGKTGGWGSQDADGDGFSNAEEMWSGSDPYNHDDTPKEGGGDSGEEKSEKKEGKSGIVGKQVPFSPVGANKGTTPRGFLANLFGF